MSLARSSIDWDEAKRRISELEKTLTQAETVTAAEAQAILRARAERLAEAAEQQPQADASIEVMILHLAGERHALETTLIREVIRPAKLTPLPSAASHFAGVMNLRGRPLLVVDGRKLLGLTGAEFSESARIIVIGDSQAEFGLLTDACDEVARLDVSELADPPHSLDESTRCFIRGVTADAMSLLNTDRLRNDPRLWIDEQED